MIRLMFSLVLTGTIAVSSATAIAQNRHHNAPATQNRCAAARPYLDYNPCNDPNAVYVGGTYAGSDPDPNIRAALAREFGRQKF
jgi:hypothetical protein